MSVKPSFFVELQRRNVYKIGAMYAVAGWLVVQAATQVLPLFEVSALVLRIIVLAVIAGFPVALILSWIYEITPEGIIRTDAVAPAAPAAGAAGGRLNRALIGFVVLAVLLLMCRLLWPALTSPGRAVTAVADTPSIAVMPLSNDGEAEQQYFSDGLSESLIGALSQLPGLKVISRNSSFQFRNSHDDAKTIGARLGVAHLLEGSVRRAGDQVRISAELVRVADGSTAWSQHFDRRYADLFQLQDEITAAVAAALKTRLIAATTASTQSDRPPGGDLDAYRNYLQGRFHVVRTSEQDDRAAIGYFEAALRLDPHYARAQSGLAQAWAHLSSVYLGGDPAQQAYTRATEAMNAALTLDPGLASAHRMHCWLLEDLARDWKAAEAECRRAVELAPADSEVLAELGWLMAVLNRPQQAVDYLQQALAADPLNAIAYHWMARFLPALGRLPEAEAAARTAGELQPGSAFISAQLSVVQVLRGDPSGALASAQASPAGNWHDFAVAVALQPGADRAAADSALQRVVSTQASNAAFQIAQLYAERHEPDAAFKWLEQARVNHDPGIELLLTDAFIKPLRSDPRFAKLCEELGLPQG
jgi:TolB-like protein/Tfp pilus assembly protein PilF